jgi:hypothetical protein
LKALLLALQKIKVPEEQKKFCIAAPEPLLMFALSCGMYSSPGVSSKHSFGFLHLTPRLALIFFLTN